MDALGRVLVLNCGSSTLKWSLLDVTDESTVAADSQAWVGGGAHARREQLGALLDRLAQVDAVGHRIVHGGGVFCEPTLIDARVRAELGGLVELDPLHMDPALAGVDAASARFPDKPQVAAFDTAFHATLPPAASAYALPWEWCERWRLRRFGFHGLSVAHSLQRAAAMLGSTPARLVVCHLGSGCSMTAVDKGRCADTTMGFTPLDGLVMATRSGSLDPGLLLYLQQRCGVSQEELLKALTLRSGLLGMSGVSGDVSEVLAAMATGNARAALAYGHFIHAAKRGLGAMIAVLGGIDALVFTGGIGEHNARVRRDLASGFEYAGVRLDESANQSPALDQNVAHPDSSVPILLIAAREDIAVLRAMRDCLRRTPDAEGR